VPAAASTSAAAAAAAAKAVPDRRRLLASKNKALPREFLLKLAEAIRAVVLPLVIEAKGREIVGAALSGDATFELDRVAERALLQHLKSAKAPVAYYSEDSGYSTFSNAQPKNLLVVDPVDGSRAAKSGFEACVISIASTRIIERPTMADVDNALVMEIVSGRYFYAERGSGARIYSGGSSKKPKLSENLDLEAVAWSMTVPGRPAELIFPTAARFIDLSSLKGGFFACNSTAFSLTRLVSNQLDACVDFAGRFYRDIPEIVKDNFLNAGRGSVLGIAPYDMVAALLIAQEAGCKVTDAYGKGFDDVLLLDSSAPNHQTMIAAASPELHHKLLNFFDTRITQLENLLKRRAAKE
jgi:myo-inositol-1(or 4)-monophosphatase